MYQRIIDRQYEINGIIDAKMHVIMVVKISDFEENKFVKFKPFSIENNIIIKNVNIDKELIPSNFSFFKKYMYEGKIKPRS